MPSTVVIAGWRPFCCSNARFTSPLWGFCGDSAFTGPAESPADPSLARLAYNTRYHCSGGGSWSCSAVAAGPTAAPQNQRLEQCRASGLEWPGATGGNRFRAQDVCLVSMHACNQVVCTSCHSGSFDHSDHSVPGKPEQKVGTPLHLTPCCLDIYIVPINVSMWPSCCSWPAEGLAAAPKQP